MTNCEVAQKLSRFGIEVLLNGGMVSLISASGVSCTYSARASCPVVGMGVDGRVFVSVKADGNAVFAIDGERLSFSVDDDSDRMDIPK